MKTVTSAFCVALCIHSYSIAGITSLDGVFIVDGTAASTFEDFNGTTTGVLVELGTGPTPSGPIAFGLDPSKVSTWTLDFTHNVQTYELNLLVTFPLQETLGALPAPIEVVESGPIQGFKLSDVGGLTITTQHDGLIKQPLMADQATTGGGQGHLIQPSAPVFFDFEATALFGGGIVTSGPFAGFEYRNGWQVTKVTVSVPGVSVEISRTPEPSTLILVSIELIVSCVAWRCRK